MTKEYRKTQRKHYKSNAVRQCNAPVACMYAWIHPLCFYTLRDTFNCRLQFPSSRDRLVEDDDNPSISSSASIKESTNSSTTSRCILCVKRRIVEVCLLSDLVLDVLFGRLENLRSSRIIRQIRMTDTQILMDVDDTMSAVYGLI